jgi:hypothetical protein
MGAPTLPAELTSKPFVLLDDLPTTDVGEADLLGTAEAAAYLSELIAASRASSPFTLGIDAGWGMGKSSLMLQLQEKLRAKEEVECVWFNAWTAEDTDALNGLIKSVLLKVDENILRRSFRKLASRQQYMGVLRVSLIILASYFHLSRVVDELWDRFSVDSRSRNELRQEIGRMFDTWLAQSKRTSHGRILVVFIDDLDRCSSETVLKVCEAVKLYLDVPGIVFILGCDQVILAQAARDAGHLSQVGDSADYMEKIVQVTYSKPAPDDDQVSRLIDHYAEKSGTRQLFPDSVKTVVIERTGRNPRRIKRLINGFVLEYRLDPIWGNFGPEALINVLLMRHFYADFYRELIRPSTQDLATEFLTYRNLRERFQLGSGPTEHVGSSSKPTRSELRTRNKVIPMMT